jgi:hypothetical protein
MNAPPDKVFELLLDNSRIAEYNKYSRGREDIALVGPNTRIVRNRTMPPLSKKGHEFCTIMHVVRRSDGSQVMLTRYTEHPKVPASPDYVRSYILLGVTEVRPHASDPNKAVFTTVSHVKSPGVPPFLAEQLSYKGLVDYAVNLDAVFSGRRR